MTTITPTTPEQLLSVSEAARLLGARPRDITDLFYRRQLRDDLCPIVGGRRLITESYLGMVAQVLRRNGKPCDHHASVKGTNQQGDEASQRLEHTASLEEGGSAVQRPISSKGWRRSRNAVSERTDIQKDR